MKEAIKVKNTKNSKYKPLKRGTKLALYCTGLALMLAITAVAGFNYAKKDAGDVVAALEDTQAVVLRTRDSVSEKTLFNYNPADSETADDTVTDPSEEPTRELPSADDPEDVEDIDLNGRSGEIVDPANITVHVDGRTYSILTLAATVRDALEQQHIAVKGSDTVEGAELSDVPETGMDIVITRVVTDTRTEVETIPYETNYLWDSEMMEGEYRTITEGKNGSITRTYTLIYEDGVLVSETLASEERVNRVDELIAYGSRSSFTNYAGDRIDYSYYNISWATAYIPDAKWGYQTYVGERARPGVVAVDPSVIPLGTKLYIQSLDPSLPDYGYAIAWDVGGHVIGNWVDMFVEEYDIACFWGAHNVKVYILEDQSVDIFALRSDYYVFIPKE